MEKSGKTSSIRSYRLVKPYLKEKRMVIALGLVSLFVVDMLQLFVPRIVKWVVDDLTEGTMTTPLLVEYAIYVVCIALLIGVFRFLWRRCLIGTSRRVEEGIRNRFFHHVQGLSADYFDVAKTGDLMAHATNDVQHIRMAVGMGMVALTDAIVLGCASIGFMLYINVKLTVFALIPMPIIVLLARFITRKMHGLYKAVQASFAELTESVRERYAGIRVIKAYNREGYEAEKVQQMSRDYVGRNMQLVRVTGAFFPGMLFFSNMSVAIVLFLGGRQAIDLTITPGDFVAFISYLGLLTWPMMAMGWVINLIQRGAASLERINTILQTPPKIVTPKNPQPIGRIHGDVVFEKVDFRYADGLPLSLDGISFRISPGQTLGIVGPTGSGKTTVCHLLPRILDVNMGRILLDGQDIRNLSLDVLRAHIAMAPQDAFLFAGTIRENLSFGMEDASTEDMSRACRAAQFYDTVMGFPNQFETVIGEKGVTLSGGQRQRLALARALLVETPILVLDDPLSQVDTETAAAILANIQRLAGSSTTMIMVSHRISHVRDADVIMVLEEGKMTATGQHEKLMAASEFYRNMYHWQEIESEMEARKQSL